MTLILHDGSEADALRKRLDLLAHRRARLELAERDLRSEIAHAMDDAAGVLTGLEVAERLGMAQSTLRRWHAEAA